MTLDTILATTRVVESNTFGRHVTMTGEQFMSVHPYFDKISETLLKLRDYVAEAIRRTGSIPVHTMADCILQSQVKEEVVIKPMHRMLIMEAIELGTLVEQIHEIIKEGIRPSLESGLSNFSDELEEHIFWLQSTTNVW